VVNKARGEAGIRIGDKTLAIAFNLGALAAIEEEFGVESYDDVLSDIAKGEKMSATRLRRVFVAVLEANGHGAETDLIDTLMPADMNELAIELLTRAFPDPGDKKARGKGGSKNP